MSVMLCCVVLFCLDSKEVENFIHTPLTLPFGRSLSLEKVICCVSALAELLAEFHSEHRLHIFEWRQYSNFRADFPVWVFFPFSVVFPLLFIFHFFLQTVIVAAIVERYFRIHSNQIHKSPAGLAFNASTLSACGSMDLLHPRRIKSTISISIHAIHIYPLLWCAIHSFTFNLTYHV